jgi:hypothetical protein
MNDPSTEIPSLSTMLIRNQQIFASEIDDEMVMMDGEQGLYFGLNSVARRIWEHLENPLAYGALLRALAEQYEVDETRCRADVEPFLRKMLEKRLIRIYVE